MVLFGVLPSKTTLFDTDKAALSAGGLPDAPPQRLFFRPKSAPGGELIRSPVSGWVKLSRQARIAGRLGGPVA